MTKRTEHIRRALLRGGPRWLALGACGACAAAMLLAVDASVRLVRVADRSGTLATAITALTEPGDLLDLTEVELGADDAAVLDLMEDEATLRVLRAFPVEIEADGGQVAVQIAQGTVADALKKGGVALAGDDFTEPALTAPLAEGMGPIAVHRVTYEDTVTTEPVPFDTQYIEEGDPETSRYHHNILQQTGEEGLQEVTTRARYVDGEYDSSEVVSTLVTVEPVPEVFATVHNNVVSPLPAPEGITVENNVPSSYSTVYTMKATGYYSPRGRGASGLGLYYGTFAVDPTLIPYGTKVYIVSTDGRFVYGWAIATDTGAFIHQNRMQVDLFYETYAESAANGVKQVYVYVP